MSGNEDPEKNRARSRAWRAANPGAARKSYLAHREERLRYSREYREAHREKIYAYNREYRLRDPEKRRTYDRKRKSANPERERAYRIRWTHGLRLEDWAAMWAAQGGRCYLCGRELAQDKSTHVDHDHSHCPGDRSCRICQRGLACKDCNTAIGLSDDDPDRLRRMADALEAANLAVRQRITTAGKQLTLD